MCPTAGLFGVPCPGCGLTRAALAALTGHPAEALRLHPLVFVATPALGMLVVSSVYQPRWLRGPRVSRALEIGGAALVVALLVVWALRFAGALGGPVPVAPWLR